MWSLKKQKLCSKCTIFISLLICQKLIFTATQNPLYFRHSGDWYRIFPCVANIVLKSIQQFCLWSTHQQFCPSTEQSVLPSKRTKENSQLFIPVLGIAGMKFINTWRRRAAIYSHKIRKCMPWQAKKKKKLQAPTCSETHKNAVDCLEVGVKWLAFQWWKRCINADKEWWKDCRKKDGGYINYYSY